MPSNKNTTAVKERLTYALIGQIFIITLSSLALIFYIVPKWKEINTKVEETNASIANYETTKKNGLPTKKIKSIIVKDQTKKELFSLIQKNEKAVAKVIKKGKTQKSYIDWINDSLNNSNEDRKKIQIIKAKMNSIVPTLSPITSTIEETQVSLKNYVDFIENKLLTNFKIKSTSPLSIDKITYAKDTAKSPMGNIGYLDFNLQFEGNNEHIYKFLDYIHTLGNTEILTQTGVTFDTIDQVPAVMTNPLVTIESLTLNDEIDIDTKKDKLNAGVIILRFYVRGSAPSDANFLAKKVESKKKELSEALEKAKKVCEKQKEQCEKSKKTRLKEFETKYNEFLRVAKNIKIDAKK